MKPTTSILIVTVFCFASAGFVGCSRQEEKKTPSAELEKVNSALAELQKENDRLKLLAPASGLSPTDTLTRLALLNPAAPESRIRSIRLIVHHLEALVDAGTNAIQPMRTFIASGADVDYAFEDNRSGGPTFWNWHPGQSLASGLVLPPTLRLGLADVFRLIGGESGEVSLAWMLNTTTHGVEVAYIAQALEKIAPGKYTELATQAAKKLLTEQPAIGTPNRADAGGNAALYAWLGSHGDTSMVASAREHLIDANGKFDPAVARYLLTTDRAQTLALLKQTYDRAANSDTQNKIANVAFDAVGSNPDANAIFLAYVTSDSILDSSSGSIVARPREIAIRSLAGPVPPFNYPAPTDPDVIRQRIDLVEQIRAKVNSGLLAAAADQTAAQLKQLLGNH